MAATLRLAALTCLAALAVPRPAGAADGFADVETGLVSLLNHLGLGLSVRL